MMIFYGSCEGCIRLTAPARATSLALAGTFCVMAPWFRCLLITRLLKLRRFRALLLASRRTRNLLKMLVLRSPWGLDTARCLALLRRVAGWGRPNNGEPWGD